MSESNSVVEFYQQQLTEVAMAISAQHGESDKHGGRIDNNNDSGGNNNSGGRGDGSSRGSGSGGSGGNGESGGSGENDDDDNDNNNNGASHRHNADDDHDHDHHMVSSDNNDDKSGKIFACDHCDKIFTRKHNLETHKLVHSEFKPYICSMCKSSFKRSHDLKRHQRMHTGEKPHPCDKCGRSFARADALLRHRKNGCSSNQKLIAAHLESRNPDEINSASPLAVAAMNSDVLNNNDRNRRSYETVHWKASISQPIDKVQLNQQFAKTSSALSNSPVGANSASGVYDQNNQFAQETYDSTASTNSTSTSTAAAAAAANVSSSGLGPHTSAPSTAAPTAASTSASASASNANANANSTTHNNNIRNNTNTTANKNTNNNSQLLNNLTRIFQTNISSSSHNHQGNRLSSKETNTSLEERVLKLEELHRKDLARLKEMEGRLSGLEMLLENTNSSARN